MNSENETFEELRRLLKLKRYEQPPPGFFAEFSERVMVRVEAIQYDRSLSWWQRLLGCLEERPLLAGASGVACCGVLLCGLSLSQLVADTSIGLSSLLEPVDADTASAASGVAVFPVLGVPPTQASMASGQPSVLLEEAPDLTLQTLGLKAMAIRCQYP